MNNVLVTKGRVSKINLKVNTVTNIIDHTATAMIELIWREVKHGYRMEIIKLRSKL